MQLAIGLQIMNLCLPIHSLIHLQGLSHMINMTIRKALKERPLASFRLEEKNYRVFQEIFILRCYGIKGCSLIDNLQLIIGVQISQQFKSIQKENVQFYQEYSCAFIF